KPPPASVTRHPLGAPCALHTRAGWTLGCLGLVVLETVGVGPSVVREHAARVSRAAATRRRKGVSSSGGETPRVRYRSLAPPRRGGRPQWNSEGFPSGADSSRATFRGASRSSTSRSTRVPVVGSSMPCSIHLGRKRRGSASAV